MAAAWPLRLAALQALRAPYGRAYGGINMGLRALEEAPPEMRDLVEPYPKGNEGSFDCSPIRSWIAHPCGTFDAGGTLASAPSFGQLHLPARDLPGTLLRPIGLNRSFIGTIAFTYAADLLPSTSLYFKIIDKPFKSFCNVFLNRNIICIKAPLISFHLSHSLF